MWSVYLSSCTYRERWCIQVPKSSERFDAAHKLKGALFVVRLRTTAKHVLLFWLCVSSHSHYCRILGTGTFSQRLPTLCVMSCAADVCSLQTKSTTPPTPSDGHTHVEVRQACMRLG